MEHDYFITVNPASYYHDACRVEGLVKPNQHIVVRFSAWSKWFNEQRFSRKKTPVPPPAFIGDTYEIVKSVADELNASLTV
jgi:hypothetical protein